MTFNDILTEVGRRLNYAGGVLTPDAKVRMLAFLNHRHRQVLSKCPKLRDATVPFITVSGQQQYSLPSSVAKVKDIYDPRVNMRKLTCATRSSVRQYGPQAEIQAFGPPAEWVDMGIVAHQNRIVAQPSLANTGTPLSVTSTQNDTGNVTIEYLRVGGYPGSATATLAGNAVVQIGTNTDITNLTKMYMSTTSNGFVTVQTPATPNANTVISTLAPGQTFARFKSILLFPTPSANTVLLMDVVRTIPDAVANVNDEPLLDLDHQWILIEGVLMDEYQKMSDARYAMAKGEYETGIRDLESEILNNDDWIVIPGGSSPTSFPFKIPASGTNYGAQ
jgi:hypothetical protein